MIPHNRVCLTPQDGTIVSNIVSGGHVGQGPVVALLEEALADRFGRPGGAAVCVSSGTAAIRLAVIALGIDVVTLPTYACTALYHAVNDGVSRIKLLDCTQWTLASRSATVVVHTYGTPTAVLGQVEDFTHAPGGEYNGLPCGSMGSAAVISFGATKPLGAGGGGAVLGAPDLIEAIRDMRDYDGKPQLRPRFNWMMSDLHAALVLRRLGRLDDDNAWRRATAEIYAAVCREKGLGIYSSAHSTFYRFVVHVPDVPKAIAHFAGHQVETISPLAPWELLHRQFGMEPDRWPAAEDAAAHALSLPIWAGMEDGDVSRVCEVLKTLEA